MTRSIIVFAVVAMLIALPWHFAISGEGVATLPGRLLFAAVFNAVLAVVLIRYRFIEPL